MLVSLLMKKKSRMGEKFSGWKLLLGMILTVLLMLFGFYLLRGEWRESAGWLWALGVLTFVSLVLQWISAGSGENDTPICRDDFSFHWDRKEYDKAIALGILVGLMDAIPAIGVVMYLVFS